MKLALAMGATMNLDTPSVTIVQIHFLDQRLLA